MATNRLTTLIFGALVVTLPLDSYLKAAENNALASIVNGGIIGFVAAKSANVLLKKHFFATIALEFPCLIVACSIPTATPRDRNIILGVACVTFWRNHCIYKRIGWKRGWKIRRF